MRLRDGVVQAGAVIYHHFNVLLGDKHTDMKVEILQKSLETNNELQYLYKHRSELVSKYEGNKDNSCTQSRISIFGIDINEPKKEIVDLSDQIFNIHLADLNKKISDLEKEFASL